MSYLSTDFKSSVLLMAVELMWLHRWKKDKRIFPGTQQRPGQYPPIHDAFPCRVAVHWMASQWVEAQPTGPHKLGIVLVLHLEKKMGCVNWESLRGGTSDCCVLRIPGLHTVFGELNQNRKKKDVEARPLNACLLNALNGYISHPDIKKTKKILMHLSPLWHTSLASACLFGLPQTLCRWLLVIS